MSDDITPEDIEQDAASNAAEGIATAAADGVSVSAIDPIKQLDVADRLRRRKVRDPFATMRHTRLIPGASR